MAGGWYALLEAPVAGVPANPEGGRALLYFHHQIDELASQLNVVSLSSFFRPDPEAVAQYLRDQGIEPNAEVLPEEEWFEAADCLVTVHKLLERLRQGRVDVPQPANIIADLESLELDLTTAAQHGKRFHLARKLPQLHE